MLVQAVQIGKCLAVVHLCQTVWAHKQSVSSRHMQLIAGRGIAPRVCIVAPVWHAYQLHCCMNAVPSAQLMP